MPSRRHARCHTVILSLVTVILSLGGCGTSSQDAEPPLAPLRHNTEPEGIRSGPAGKWQVIIDHPAIQDYLHLEETRFVPLQMYLPAELRDDTQVNLRAGGQPVQLVNEQEQARLLVVGEQAEPMGFAVQVEIPDEGVSGTIQLQQHDRDWRVLRVLLTEH